MDSKQLCIRGPTIMLYIIIKDNPPQTENLVKLKLTMDLLSLYLFHEGGNQVSVSNPESMAVSEKLYSNCVKVTDWAKWGTLNVSTNPADVSTCVQQLID